MRYSELAEINRSNVAKLRVAWVHHTGDKLDRPATTIECTPVVVDGVMYVTTARLQVRALDGASGKVLWNFDPFAGSDSLRPRGVNRGVSFWQDGKDKRIFAAIQTQLYCLNAQTGEPVRSFGDNGAVDLKKNFDRDMTDLFYKCTSPPVLYENLVIVGGGGGEGPRPTGPGHIRAYDVHTGKRRWIFHTIPFPGEFGHDTWGPDCWKKTGGTNSWAGMSLDAKRGLVFPSTGSPSFDFYGGDRPGKNLFGNCVIALKARTGERVWHYQIVHHDLWDFDLGCQPILVIVNHKGRPVEAVAQLAKTGMVFLLDRETGEPLFPVEERPVPASDVPGEKAWPTQPFPTRPAPFTRSSFTEDQITNLSPESRAHVMERLEKLRTGPVFTPPSKQGTVVYPGYGGGPQWGGGSFDPESGRLFVNSNDVPWIITLVDADPGAGYPYNHTGFEMFLDPSGYPANKPPWGYIVAIDLNKGETVWKVPLGEYKELTAKGIPPTGTYNLGGSIATKGGLVFTGAAQDEKFRAFDTTSGRVLWEAQLEAGGYATPCTYEAGGKQHVVIAAGGAGLKIQTKPGDAFVAFALPD